MWSIWSHGILATDPTRQFWQPDWSLTCSWLNITHVVLHMLYMYRIYTCITYSPQLLIIRSPACCTCLFSAVDCDRLKQSQVVYIHSHVIQPFTCLLTPTCINCVCVSKAECVSQSDLHIIDTQIMPNFWRASAGSPVEGLVCASRRYVFNFTLALNTSISASNWVGLEACLKNWQKPQNIIIYYVQHAYICFYHYAVFHLSIPFFVT